jgi:hypothetical protein
MCASRCSEQDFSARAIATALGVHIVLVARTLRETGKSSMDVGESTYRRGERAGRSDNPIPERNPGSRVFRVCSAYSATSCSSLLRDRHSPQVRSKRSTVCSLCHPVVMLLPNQSQNPHVCRSNPHPRRNVQNRVKRLSPMSLGQSAQLPLGDSGVSRSNS